MNWSSAKVRDTFVQFFIRHSSFPHVYVPSSSIVPKNDPSLAFVNAGMNQFKDVILGYGRPSNVRVTNSQKCLRINDLQLVGADTYHHTFFEMLGNWSFSNYFKREACVMAWDLLTNVYKLDPQRLYVTYFSGGHGLPIDRETREIWEDIGVSPARILPFGKENFWSMGPIGPCGPSTEIHYDHRGTAINPDAVNQDLGAVVELWNLVFMQFNRSQNGILERLPLSHVVDTGAGLERLTAVLNGKVSNYDTDLFYPIFDTVHKITGVCKYRGSFRSDLDCTYRVFADHLRAATVALSDGIMPQTNQKVRRLIQRSLSLTESHFLPKVEREEEITDFLSEVVDTISLSLSQIYPEIEKMKDETLEILEDEVGRYIASSKSKSTFHALLPRLLTVDFPALARIKKEDIEFVKEKGTVDGETAFKWYGSLGVSEEAVEGLCGSLGIIFDRGALQKEMEKVKKIYRDDIAKELISNEQWNFVKKVESLLLLYNPQVSGGVLSNKNRIYEEGPIFVEWVFDDEGNPVEEISNPDSHYWVVLNKSPFYPGTPSIVSDTGSIELENNCCIKVISAQRLPSGWILHQLRDIPEIGFRRKAKVLSFNIDTEICSSREMSIASLRQLKTWFKNNYGVVRFNDEHIHAKYVNFEITILNGDLNPAEIQKCENYLLGCELPLVITGRNWKQSGVYDLTCATGSAAYTSQKYGHEVFKNIIGLKEILTKPNLNYMSFRDIIKKQIDVISKSLYSTTDKVPLPYDIFVKAEKIIAEAEKFMEKQDVLLETERLARELEQLVASDNPVILELFRSDAEFTSLGKLSRVTARKPTLIVILSSDGFIQARCTVPKEMAVRDFTAELWMKSLVDELDCCALAKPPKGWSAKIVVNLKKIRIPQIEVKLELGLQKAREYVNRARQTDSDQKLSRQSDQ